MKNEKQEKLLNIVIPMAGKGTRFSDAGYAFPKPLIDVNGKTMIEVVVNNLRPTIPHRFIFICLREHYEKYDLHNILKNATHDKFEVVLAGPHQGAACAVMFAAQYVNNDSELLIANSDQYVEISTDSFVKEARKKDCDGLIMTFKASHPKWSYARVDKNGQVLEVAEKVVISNQATVGIYYFKKGSDFMEGAESMIHKNIRHNNEFYVCPVYNELLLKDKKVFISEISDSKMHGLGTPEDLNMFLKKTEQGKIKSLPR
jgi:dTDP-glucose pyrophosphorylase